MSTILEEIATVTERADEAQARGCRVVIRGATKHYGQLAALDSLDLVIEPGRVVVLLGPSGSGKSTLLRSLAGIEKLDSGTIQLGDTVANDGPRTVAPERRDLAMVFQDYALWPHLSARQNVAYALKRRRLPTRTANARVDDALERVGLGGKGEHYPHELSGGQQQRVALARAVIAEPALLLFDEPLSNLDADLRERLRVEISTLVRDSGATAVYITHDQAEAFALADEVGVLRAGKLEQYATPEEIYHDPRTPFVARFTGLSGVFTGRVEAEGGGTARIRVGDERIVARTTMPMGPGDRAEVMVRPTAVALCGGDPAPAGTHSTRFPAVVTDVAYRGRGYEHVVETAHGSLSAVFDTRAAARGTRCSVEIDAGGCIAFPASS